MPNELDVRNSPAGRQAQLNAIRNGNVNERRVGAPTNDELMGALVGESSESETQNGGQVPENAIVRRDDGAMVYKRFVMTATGMEIPDDTTGEEWQDFGAVVMALDSSIAWNVGDWEIGRA